MAYYFNYCYNFFNKIIKKRSQRRLGLAKKTQNELTSAKLLAEYGWILGTWVTERFGPWEFTIENNALKLHEPSKGRFSKQVIPIAGNLLVHWANGNDAFFISRETGTPVFSMYLTYFSSNPFKSEKPNGTPAFIMKMIRQNNICLKIAVLTLQFGELDYFKHTSEINRKYCNRFGYEWIIASAVMGQQRNPIWSKVKRTSELLLRGDYNYVVFMDADAWFHNQTKRIESLIETHFDDSTQILVGTNRRDRSFAWNDSNANTGVFIAKNTPLGVHIFAEWWHACIYDPETAFRWPVEQLAFHRHIFPRWHRVGAIKLIPYYMMTGLDGEFIRHAAGLSNRGKTETIKAAHKTLLGIDM